MLAVVLAMVAPRPASACGGEPADPTEPGQWGLLPVTDATTGELASEVLLIPPQGLDLTAWVRVYLGEGRSFHTEVPLGVAAATDLLVPLDLPDELDTTWAKVSVRVLASEPTTGEVVDVRGLRLAAYSDGGGDLVITELHEAEAEATEVRAVVPQVASVALNPFLTPPDEEGLAEGALVEDWLGKEVSR